MLSPRPRTHTFSPQPTVVDHPGGKVAHHWGHGQQTPPTVSSKGLPLQTATSPQLTASLGQPMCFDWMMGSTPPNWPRICVSCMGVCLLLLLAQPCFLPPPFMGFISLQTSWLKNIEIYSLTALKLEVQNQEVSRVMLPLNLCIEFFLASF